MNKTNKNKSENVGYIVAFMLVILVSGLGFVFAQSSQITGEITLYPTEIIIGERYDLLATSNADKVIFSLHIDHVEIWDRSESVRKGEADESIRLSSLTDTTGPGVLYLIDYDTDLVLDQKDVLVIDPDANPPSDPNPLQDPNPPSDPNLPSEIFGYFTDYPIQIIPRVDFVILAETNARKVNIELYRNSDGDRIFRNRERPDDFGVVEIFDDISSREGPGEATLYLIDYDTDVILDQKDIVIIDPDAPSDPNPPQDPPTDPLPPEPDPIIFLLPGFPDDGRVMEGDWITAEVKNGIGHSRFYIDILYDNNIVYSHSFTETDANGNVNVRFQMPYKLLKPGHSEDGLKIRLRHGSVEANQAFVLVKGLDIIIPSEIKEGEPFTYEVKHSAGNTAVKAGIDYDAGNNHEFGYEETDGSGYTRITETVDNLITNRADRDGAEFWVETKDVKWLFRITIIKGERQSNSDATVNKIESVQGQDLYPLPQIEPVSIPITYSIPNIYPLILPEQSSEPQPIGVVSDFHEVYSDCESIGEAITPILEIIYPSFKCNGLVSMETRYFGEVLSASEFKIKSITTKARFPFTYWAYVCPEIRIFSEGREIYFVDVECHNFNGVSSEWSIFAEDPGNPLILNRDDNEIQIGYSYTSAVPWIGEPVNYGDPSSTIDLVVGRLDGALEDSFIVP